MEFQWLALETGLKIRGLQLMMDLLLLQQPSVQSEEMAQEGETTSNKEVVGSE